MSTALFRAAPVAVVIAALAIAGCDDPNRMFTGVWELEEEAVFTVFEGYPTVYLGHYGREVAGNVRFAESFGHSELVSSCGCAYVQHRGVNIDRKEVAFSTICSEDWGDSSAPRLDWRLEMVEDGVLEGSVGPSDGSPGDQIRLVREVTEVENDYRVCPNTDADEQ